MNKTSNFNNYENLAGDIGKSAQLFYDFYYQANPATPTMTGKRQEGFEPQFKINQTNLFCYRSLAHQNAHRIIYFG